MWEKISRLSSDQKSDGRREREGEIVRGRGGGGGEKRDDVVFGDS